MVLKRSAGALMMLLAGAFAVQAQSVDKVSLNVSVANKGGAPTVTLKKSPECQAYCLALFTSDIAGIIKDEVVDGYFTGQKKPRYTDNAKDKKLVDYGLVVVPEKEYTLIALGYGKDGKPGKVSRTQFTAPRRQGFASAQVLAQVINIGSDSVTVKFTPNTDVAGYALCQFEGGTIEQTVKEHGPMMGFSNAYDMIKQFSGKDYTTEKQHTWREMVPDANYELCVLAWDKNGVFQEITKVPVTTKKLGGPGEATVDIKIGEFGGSKKGGYYQDVVYSPNDQASLHRDIIITEEAFNKPDMGNIGVIKMLQTDHPKDIYWNQYRVDRARWNATPLTTYYACSMAKNVDGKWGELKKVKFTTPAAKE